MAVDLIAGEEGLSEDQVADAFERLYGDDPKPAPKAAPAPKAKVVEDKGSDETPETPEDETEEEAQPDEDAPAEDETEETDSDEESEQGGDEDVLFTVKNEDGTESSITRAEARNGYLRNADYTRKTQAVAEARRKLDAELGPEKEAFRAERVKYVDQLAKLETLMIGEAPEEPDWAALEAANPAEFVRQHALWQIHVERVKAVRAERTKEEQKLQTEFAQRQAAIAEQETELLFTARPDWRDPVKRQTAMKDLAGFAETMGWTKQDLASIADHRLFLLLEKGMLYDKLKGQIVPKPKDAKVLKATTPTLKPGSTQTPTPTGRKASDLTRAKQRLAKTGSVHDAAAAFDLLGK